MVFGYSVCGSARNNRRSDEFYPEYRTVDRRFPCRDNCVVSKPDTCTLRFNFISRRPNLDGFLITPLIQKRAISIPPVLIIAAQLLLAVIFGFLGLLLAVPLVAIVFLMVKMIYVEDILDRQVEIKGD